MTLGRVALGFWYGDAASLAARAATSSRPKARTWEGTAVAALNSRRKLKSTIRPAPIMSSPSGSFATQLKKMRASPGAPRPVFGLVFTIMPSDRQAPCHLNGPEVT